jgi:hypothetical protein
MKGQSCKEGTEKRRKTKSRKTKKRENEKGTKNEKFEHDPRPALHTFRRNFQ